MVKAIVARAKKAGVPKEVVEKALNNSKDNSNAQSDVYEGAIGSVLVIVEVLTDNRSRTAMKIREALKAAGGAMGTSGCASWAFSRKGLLSFEGSGGRAAMEALVEVAIDAGADDVLERRDEHLLDTATAETAEADGASFKLDVWTQPDELALVKSKLVEAAYEPVDERLVFKANQPVALGGEKRDIVDAAFNDLRDLEDVEDVWHNLLPDEDESEEA